MLINKFDIKDQDKLEKIDLRYSTFRIMKLQEHPIVDGQWDLKHLQKIHQSIFQDVYPFAGKIRTEQIGKGNFRFASPLYIESEAARVFKELKMEQYLTGLHKSALCERMAYYFSEVNVLHPFREGNGRTEREFLRTLALKNGYTLDFKKMSRSELLRASERSVMNAGVMVSLFQQAILEDMPNPVLLRRWEHFSTKATYELPERLKRQRRSNKGKGFER
ncbi:MAG: Fic family protein [Sporolactobacillus sp.]